MRGIVLGIILSLVAISSGLAYADSTTFQIKGNGAAVLNSDNPVLYTSSMHISLSSPNAISSGAVLVKTSDGMIVARFVVDTWKFTYDNDGSFHAEGSAQTPAHDNFAVSLDGIRLVATGTGSMW